MSEWQPIDTAPKDGTQILIWSKPWMAAAFWYTGEDGDEPEPFWAVWEGHDMIPAFRRDLMHPTHWRPLPEPPTS